MISLDFSPTLTWPRPRRWRAAKTETMLIGRTLGVFLLGGLRTGPTHRLAIDGDHFGRSPRLRSDPGDKATPERLAVERSPDVAQVVVRQRSVRKGSEASGKRPVSACRTWLRDRLRPGDDGERRHNSKISSSGYLTLATLPNVRRSLK